MIVVDRLTKRFGDVAAVDDLSFSVAAGSVTGFLGPNGAGKSTTLRAILGLVRPTSGEATVLGRRFEDLEAPATEVGALLEASEFHRGVITSHISRGRPGSRSPGWRRSSPWSSCRARAHGVWAATRWACGSGSDWRGRCWGTRTS